MNLQDLCERIARDAIPATDSGATCFVPRHQIDQLREALSAPQPPIGGEVWQHPDTLPPVESGQYGWFWVAVRRTNGRVYSFPATYLNAMVLTDENGDQEESRGNRYHHGPVDQDDGTFEATGWHDAKAHSEYSAIYLPLLDSDKDELIAWRSVADYGDTAPPSAPDRDAYEGAREDLLDWKRRAQRAESTLRGLGYGGIDASEPPSAPVGVEAVLRDALQGLIDFIEIDNLPMDADAMFIAKRALAQQPAAELYRCAECDDHYRVGTPCDCKVQPGHPDFTPTAQQPAAVDGAKRSRYMKKLWLDEWLSDHDVELAADAYDELLDALAAQENDDA